MRDYSREQLEFILDTADEMVELEKKGSDACKGKVLASLFFEPSTRTRLSFETAMFRLGGNVTTVADPMTSSAKKGESFEDTILTVQNYADIIAMRHPDDDVALRAAKVAKIPYINGGSGTWEHPTQTMLDLHCMRYAKVRLISPDQLKMKPDVIEGTGGRIEISETNDLKSVLPELDVMYVTRVQKERFADPAEYEKVKDAYVVDADLLKKGKKDVVVMHPLPRINEIAADVDPLPNAWYFRQVKHGIYARMAIIGLALGVL